MSATKSMAWWTAACLLVGCGGGGGDGPAADPDAGPPPVDAGPPGLAVLGNGAHTIDAVDLTVVATADDALNFPRDLAFDPERPGTLWVVNGAEHSITILTDVGTPEQDWMRRGGPGSEHFLSRPSAIAFGAPGFFATAHDEDRITQPTTPEDFMGPTLWTSDLTEFDGGHHGHMDMLHNSPSAVGIAWERDNVYWVLDGAHGALTRYDFQADHGLGGEDHSDGIVARHVEGQLGYVANVSSHVAYHAATGLLYATDSGNRRVVVVDPSTGTRAGVIEPNYDDAEMHNYEGTTLTTLVDGAALDMVRPSGLHLAGDVLFVGDHGTSKVFAFSLDGTLLDWVDLSSQIPPDSMMGIDADPEGRLFLADATGDRIFRLAPRSP